MSKLRLRVSAWFLCLTILLPLVACKKIEKPASASVFSPCYSTTNTILSIPNVISSAFSEGGAFVQSYNDTDDYRDAYRKQCIPTSDDFENLPYLPVDEKGTEIAPENLLYVVDANGEVKTTYDLNKECRPSRDARAMFCTKEGCWILTSRADIYSDQAEYFLDCFDPDKGVTRHIDLNLGTYNQSLYGFQVCEDGRFILTGGDRKVYVVDPDGNQKEIIDLPETYESGDVVLWNGKLICAGLGNERQVLFQYDENTKQWVETNVAVTDAWNKLLVKGEELFSIEHMQIVRLDETEPATLVLEDVSVWGVVDDLKLFENGEIELLVRPMSEELFIWYHLAPSDKKEQESKKEFVIAGYDLQESILPRLVEELSLLHPDVKFIVRDYKDEIQASEDNGAQIRKEIYEIVSLDIASGNAPDLYFDRQDTIGLGEMARLGYLTDLAQYLGSLDQSEYFMDKIIMGEDTPYCACLSFDILCFQASAKNVDNADTWTYDDFYRCAKSYTDLTCVQSVFSKQTLLRYGVLAQMDMFIKNGKANFTGDDFLMLLKWSNDIGKREDWEDYTDAELDSGLFMLDWASISTPGSVIDYQDHVIVGFPNENGSLHVVPYNMLAISATSSQAELGGEIILYALGGTFQKGCDALRQDGMVVNKLCWEQDFEETYKFYSESSSQKLKYSKDEYYAMAIETLDRADRYIHGYKSVMDIVLEESAAYYSGDYSAEQAAALIQDRVNTYLQETCT